MHWGGIHQHLCCTFEQFSSEQQCIEEFPALPKDILKKLAFLHGEGITAGGALLNPN